MARLVRSRALCSLTYTSHGYSAPGVHSTYIFSCLGWLYVALSRVRSIQGLYLLAPIETDPTKYALRLDVMALLERMQLIESATLARLAASVSCRQAFPFTLQPAAPAAVVLPRHYKVKPSV